MATSTISMLGGINIYSVIALLIAAVLLFHVTSTEEMITFAVAAVAIVYIMQG